MNRVKQWLIFLGYRRVIKRLEARTLEKLTAAGVLEGRARLLRRRNEQNSIPRQEYPVALDKGEEKQGCH